ncbi:MAG: thymidine phosphorylase [Anaeroplasmataceae bacterium]
MRMVDLIVKKRDNIELSDLELKYIIDGFTNNKIPDYQVSAFLMAVYFNSLSRREINTLTNLMKNSGDLIDTSKIKGILVDKHSTGGVGDKVSFIVAPILASLGLKVLKMSGKGLGITGGTIDKLQSIKGFDTELTEDEFIKQVNKINMAIISQTKNLTPADKLLYALRDVTGTVDSIPLIASSIMSKKLTTSAQSICLDVKFGSGAFMQTIEKAEELARVMIDIGKDNKKNMTAIISNMNKPLGKAIGNKIEVYEAIETLKGNGPIDLIEVCLTISANLVFDSKLTNTFDEAYKLCQRQLDNKEAYNKFMEFVKYQGGNVSTIESININKLTKYVYEVKSAVDGYVTNIDAYSLGQACINLGAGRATKESEIDYNAGLYINKQINDFIKVNDVICTIYSNIKNIDNIIEMVNKGFTFGKEKVVNKNIYNVLK